ncbi:hypothetical protein L596_001407 [Steinernema carpocapsae]|uniref:C2H2-type domain-containing protein n=1 Tax=Steinernema carpocapsae TaxID=34508 RepID=A0A4U8UN69_STECR|nr:hypothetical protein L596_001407 [Steinernema carpocapsae]
MKGRWEPRTKRKFTFVDQPDCLLCGKTMEWPGQVMFHLLQHIDTSPHGNENGYTAKLFGMLIQDCYQAHGKRLKTKRYSSNVSTLLVNGKFNLFNTLTNKRPGGIFVEPSDLKRAAKDGSVNQDALQPSEAKNVKASPPEIICLDEATSSGPGRGVVQASQPTNLTSRRSPSVIILTPPQSGRGRKKALRKVRLLAPRSLRKQLSIHLRKARKCSKCDTICNDEQSVERHVKSHINAKLSCPFEEDGCKTRAVSAQVLNKHVQTSHHITCMEDLKGERRDIMRTLVAGYNQLYKRKEKECFPENS